MRSTILYLYNILRIFIPETHFFRFKRFSLRCAGFQIGKNVRICSSARLVGSGNIYIGENTWIGPNCLIVSNFPCQIKIGKNVDIAPNVYIGNGSHEIDMIGKHSAGAPIVKNIDICDGVWVGANSTILLGVSIGYKSVIAAGGVVNKSIDKKELVGGVPCKLIKKY